MKQRSRITGLLVVLGLTILAFVFFKLSVREGNVVAKTTERHRGQVYDESWRIGHDVGILVAREYALDPKSGFSGKGPALRNVQAQLNDLNLRLNKLHLPDHLTLQNATTAPLANSLESLQTDASSFYNSSYELEANIEAAQDSLDTHLNADQRDYWDAKWRDQLDKADSQINRAGKLLHIDETLPTSVQYVRAADWLTQAKAFSDAMDAALAAQK
jgi:MFS superfamily sulfate permease-like transporter